MKPTEIEITLEDADERRMDRSLFQTLLIKLLEKFGFRKGSIRIGEDLEQEDEDERRRKEREESLKREIAYREARARAEEEARKKMESMKSMLGMYGGVPGSMGGMPMPGLSSMISGGGGIGGGYSSGMGHRGSCNCAICKQIKSGKLKPNKILIRKREVYVARAIKM